MVLRYCYVTVPHADGTTSRVPLIPITLIGKVPVTVYAVVDSGADACALPLRLAELLGLPLTGEKERSFGIGGFIESVESTVVVALQQGRERHQFTIPMSIMLSHHTFPVLLGQKGFFDKFIIKFNNRKNKFSLKRCRKLLL